MLNTFRVIFVDQGGFIIPNPGGVGGCQYDQTGLQGYYSFDYGQPTAISQQYSYDNRTINDWFRKYGITEPDPIAGESEPPLFPPKGSASDILAGKTGGLLSGAGMTPPGKSEGGEIDRCGLGIGENELSQCSEEGNIFNQRPAYMYLRKDYGVTLDLRTPSYFFEENNTKRNINRTKALVFDPDDVPYDLKFDTNPSDPVQDGLDKNPQEIDLKANPTDYPKWIYIGILGAGGPAGAAIQALTLPTDGFGGVGCNFVGGMFSGDRIGLCPFWEDNYQTNILGPRSFPLSWDYPVPSMFGSPSGGLSSRAQDGGRAGVFINACSLDLNSDDTRTTLVVRIKELGKGGVESYNNTYRAFDEETINNTKTTFPSHDNRKTVAEIYVAGDNDFVLDSTKLLLTIEADGGKARVVSISATPTESPCNNSENRSYFCRTCEYLDTAPTGGDPVDQDCISPPIPLFSTEVYHNTNTAPIPIPGSELTNPNINLTLGDYATNNGIGIGPEAGIRPANPAEGHLFPANIENIGIRDQTDWFNKAGGIQETAKTITKNVTSNVDFFGLGSDFVFHGNTKYVLEQNLDSNQTIVINSSTSDDNKIVTPEKIEYFKFNDSSGEYELLATGAEYVVLTSSDTTKVKMELTFAPNSYENSFILTTSNGSLSLDWEFEFRRSTDQLLPPPGAAGVMYATLVDASGTIAGTGIGNGDVAHPGEFSEGVGGNGGSVFVGWGADINNAANGLGIPGGPDDSDQGLRPWDDFPLVPGTGFVDMIIRPNRSDNAGGGQWPEISNTLYYKTATSLDHWEGFFPPSDATFNQRVRSAYEGDYSPVGDPNAKGYDVAPIARFTELPELTREGDFYLTLQAYHMEGIHKVTFIMDNGEPIDVYTPVEHPDDLGTNYEGSASRLGKDYEEYMVKVSTEDMENNSVHEIRAIVWPNSGYPLVLQGEKQDSNRFIKGSALSTGNAGTQISDDLYKVTPTSYPWIPNRYPEMMGEYNPNQLDVNGNPLTIAPNPDTGGITLTDEPAWYGLDANSTDYLATINVDPADVKGQYIDGEGSENYVGQQIRTWQAIPGGLVDNFEGFVDDRGEPAWWIPGAETNNVGYHGFWFRYQKSGDATVPTDTNKYPDEGHRRVLYVDSSVDVNSSERDLTLLGTIDHPYQSLDEVMGALENATHPEMLNTASPRYEIEDYFSAKLILLGQKDSPAEGEPAGRIFKWWGSDNVITSGFQNTLDHNESRNSAQNPSCQMLTVEARKVNSETGIPVPWEEGPPIDFHPDQEAVEIYDKEVVLLLNDFGWGREFDGGEDDPSKDNGGTPFNANIHYKNVRCVTDLPTSGTNEVFRVSANTRKCDTWGPQYQEDVDDWRYKAPTEILDNCKFNSWSEWGAVSQLNYTDRTFLLKDGKIARPGPPTPAVAPEGACDQNECSYDQIDSAPLDRSKMRSIDVTLLEDGVHPAVWEKVGDNMNYIWEGDRFPDPEKDIIGPNRQLLDDRLPGYNTLIRWSFGDLDEIAAQQAAISDPLNGPEDYPDGLYVSTLNNGRGPDGVLPGDRIDLTEDTSKNWRPLKVTETDGVVFGEGVPNQRRSTGSLKNDSAFSRKLIEGYPLNLDVYSSNCITSKYGAGRRFVGVSLVKNYIESSAAGDTTARSTSGIINSIVDVRSISYFTGKRLFANGSNTVHGDLNQIDGLDIGWTDNRIHADVLMPNNGSQLAHFSGGIVRRRNSKTDDWRSAHKLRNWAIVNVISDTNQVSATWNCFESFDHFYIRGNRLNKSHIRLTANQRHGVPYLGERYDNRISHFYMADVNNGQVGIEAPNSDDGIQGGWEVVNTSIADPEYKGFARPRPQEFVDTEGTVFPGIFKYQFSRDNANTTFWPQKVSDENGGYLDSKGRDVNGYVGTPLPTNQLYWYPVYDSQNLTSPGNYTADRNSQLINNETEYDEMLKSSLAQYCDVDNSIVRFDTCIFRKWGSGGGKMVQGNIETNIFNQNGVPTIEKAYLIQGGDPNDGKRGRDYAVSAPNGVPTKDKNTFTIDLDDISPLNGDIQTVSFIPTYGGKFSDIEKLSQGFTAPIGYNDLDPNSPDGVWGNVKTYLESNVERVPSLNTDNGGEQWPRAGKVVEAYYIYDREFFKEIIANGGWNYTPKLLEDLDIDYTPHKL
jgi:hypothetical protein